MENGVDTVKWDMKEGVGPRPGSTTERLGDLGQVSRLLYPSAIKCGLSQGWDITVCVTCFVNAKALSSGRLLSLFLKAGWTSWGLLTALKTPVEGKSMQLASSNLWGLSKLLQPKVPRVTHPLLITTLSSFTWCGSVLLWLQARPFRFLILSLESLTHSPDPLCLLDEDQVQGQVYHW